MAVDGSIAAAGRTSTHASDVCVSKAQAQNLRSAFSSASAGAVRTSQAYALTSEAADAAVGFLPTF